MFPTGSWQGYWEQDGWGQQTMYDLYLHFENGKVEGSGHDCIGKFVFRGQYTNQGTVKLIKSYPGKHQVMYHGMSRNDFTIYGRWLAGRNLSGSFVMKPENAAPLVDEPIVIEKVEPNFGPVGNGNK